MEDSRDFIVKQYVCPICKMMHEVNLPRDLAESRTKFPFPFIYLHSREVSPEVQDLLTILYIDANMQVRGTEIIEVEDSNIFSADLTKQIAEKLTDKITELEEENVRLKEFLDFESDADFLATKTEPSDASDEEMDIKIEELAKETDKVIGQLLEGLAEIEVIEESADPEIDNLEVEEYSPPARKSRKPKQIKPRIKVKTPKGPKTSKRPKIDIFVASTIGPYGEKRQKLTVFSDVSIENLKETVGNIFGLDPSTFLVCLKGITMNDPQQLCEYNAEDGDEILIIPASTAGLKKQI